MAGHVGKIICSQESKNAKSIPTTASDQSPLIFLSHNACVKFHTLATPVPILNNVNDVDIWARRKSTYLTSATSSKSTHIACAGDSVSGPPVAGENFRFPDLLIGISTSKFDFRVGGVEPPSKRTHCALYVFFTCEKRWTTSPATFIFDMRRWRSSQSSSRSSLSFGAWALRGKTLACWTTWEIKLYGMCLSASWLMVFDTAGEVGNSYRPAKSPGHDEYHLYTSDY